MAHITEATQFHAKLAELKTKQAELQDVVTLAAECESAFMEQINNLEANFRSKIEEAVVNKQKRERMEERFKKFMEKNHKHVKTNTDLCRTYDILRVDNDRLQSKIKKL